MGQIGHWRRESPRSGEQKRVRQFLGEKLLRLTGYPSWNSPRVLFIPLAGEEPGTAPEETQDEEPTVMVVEDSEPEEKL